MNAGWMLDKMAELTHPSEPPFLPHLPHAEPPEADPPPSATAAGRRVYRSPASATLGNLPLGWRMSSFEEQIELFQQKEIVVPTKKNGTNSGLSPRPIAQLKQRRVARFGWVRDLPDPRDQIFAVRTQVMSDLPTRVDLRPKCPPVYNQDRIGGCTANAIAGAIQFDRAKNGRSPDFLPSRLFNYYNELYIEGDIGYDRGAQLRGIKSVNKIGVCPQSEWPYDDTPAVSERGRGHGEPSRQLSRLSPATRTRLNTYR